MPGEQITKAEVLTALSRALDLVEGQPEGHAARTCLIASRLAAVLQLDAGLRDAVFFASLLKDSGCSSNSARIHKIFGGDELLLKRNVKVVDWSSQFTSVKFALAHTEPGNGLFAKLQRMLANIGPPAKVMDEVTMARCTQGAGIAKMLGFDETVAAAVENLDEHWDGKGSPRHLCAHEIPLAARILGLAQTVEVFFTTFGLEAAMDMLRERSGRWFDPELVQATLVFQSDTVFWDSLREHASENVQRLPLDAAHEVAEEADLDQICAAFAKIVDAKSSYTAEHSTRVTEVAVRIGSAMGLMPALLQELRRAALLHDIGKLSVPNSILEKPGRLDDVEFARVREHARHSYEILKPIRAFKRVAEIAAAHHERLDGRGYWRGLTADDLDLEMRILAVADVFDALSAERPYRSALSLDQVFDIMDAEAHVALDGECIEVLKSSLPMALPKAA